MFLPDGQILDQGQILIYRLDTEMTRFGRRIERHLIALEADASAARRVHAGNASDQGGFAGAVVAYQRGDFAGRAHQAGATQCLDRTERLAQIAHFKNRVAIVHRCSLLRTAAAITTMPTAIGW